MSVDLSRFIPPELAPALSVPWVRGLCIIVVAALLAKAFDWFVCTCIMMWARRSSSELDDRLIKIAHRPIFISMLLLGMGIAAREAELAERARFYLNGGLKTLAVWFWLVFGLKASAILLDAAGSRTDGRIRLEPQIRTLLENAAKVVFVGGAIYLLLQSWGLPIATWLTSAGIVGIALGFAAKDTLANLFSGIFILADAPYKVGDFVNLDSGERGKVTQIGLRSTRLLTRDDIEITVPNAVIANAKIINETGGRWVQERVRVKVTTAYGCEVEQVRSILLQIAADNPQVLEHPAPRVRLRALGDFGLHFELLCWIAEPVLRGRVLDALYTEVYSRFNAARVEIPYPTTSIVVRQPETAAASAEPVESPPSTGPNADDERR